MGKIVVTAGDKYTDIDVLACAVAYAELLRSEGKDAEAVVSEVFNKSITADIRNWDFDFKTNFTDSDTFVIVDTSHPEYFASFVKEEKIIEIYDHHAGFEEHFEKLLGKNSHIEPIGAAATLIWEQFVKRNNGEISTSSANLLYTAIVSNTLNFNAQITNERDHKAAKDLLKSINLPDNWVEKYFSDQDRLVYANPAREIKNDSNTRSLPQFEDSIAIGQMELWNSKKFISSHLDKVKNVLQGFGTDVWFFTSPSISEGINYIYTENSEIKKLLSKLIGVKFEGDVGKTKKLWLRKEIVKKLSKEPVS